MLLEAYLTYQKGSSDKFYDMAAHPSCDIVYFRHGRTGTSGNKHTKKFSSPQAAVAHFRQKLKEKMNKGYVNARRPSSAPPYPEPLASLANSNKQSQTPVQATQPPVTGKFRKSDYTLTWATTDPVTPSHVENAFEVTDKFFRYVEAHFPKTSIIMADDGLGPYVKFIQDRKILSIFGYTPHSFLESLTQKERRLLQRGGASSQANGWLTGKGAGAGVLFTHMNQMDIFIRMFLSVLQVKSNLQMACYLGLNTSSKGLYANDEFNDFDWYPLWKEVLYPAARKCWLIHGESIFLPVETEKKTQYGLQAKYAW